MTSRAALARCLLPLPLLTTACPDFEPPPDTDTTDAADEADPGGVTNMVVNDGQGLGVIFPPRIRNVQDESAKNALVIGAPNETWEEVVEAGQVSLLLDDGVDALTPPDAVPSTFVEDLHSSSCGPTQRFAWDLLPGRKLGGALTFFTQSAGADFTEQENIPIASAPFAGQNSGRALIYRHCLSCAIFPKQDGETNLKGGRFGASMAVGFFTEGKEGLAIGAPSLAGSGRVAVLDEANFRRWEFGWDLALEGSRECQCKAIAEQGSPNTSCAPWDQALAGSFADEEFGAALIAADFNCDGRDDLAVGAPGALLPGIDPPTIPDAGAAYVYFADVTGIVAGNTPTILRQGAFEVGGVPEIGDRFGATLAAGNFNGARRTSNDRSCFDLVVASPGEDDSAGQIQIFEGSPEGLTYGGPILDLDDVFDAGADPGDLFGWSMVAGDFNRDHFDDLAIGAPEDWLGGSVTIILGDSMGLIVDKALHLRQGDGAAIGIDEFGDQFGYALSWTRLGIGGGQTVFTVLMVGSPGENQSVGQIHVLRFGKSTEDPGFVLYGDTTIHQSDIFGDLGADDRFGSVLMIPRPMPNSPWN